MYLVMLLNKEVELFDYDKSPASSWCLGRDFERNGTE